ncbi:MAG: acetylglutamate kinase [Candidatus Altiarchaeota archaeon]|nr:acetylglutamate kinase [Candidatus Altiarchaeota archaeon]
MANTRELIEALHYIKKFKDQVFIIKFSGEILSDEKVLESIALDLILLHDVGIKIIVMHGAGTLISSKMEKLGLKPRFIRGERITDEKTLDVVVSCLHQVNNRIIGKVNKEKTIALGLGGSLFRAKRKKRGLGYVGEVEDVDLGLIHDMLKNEYMPVIYPIGVDGGGQLLNINADVAAGALAKALNATKIINLTNVEGVLDKEGRLIGKVGVSEAKKLVKNKTVTGGMIPKLESGIKAIDQGVEQVHIIKAGEHAILGELLTERGNGTMITK